MTTPTDLCANYTKQETKLIKTSLQIAIHSFMSDVYLFFRIYITVNTCEPKDKT